MTGRQWHHPEFPSLLRRTGAELIGTYALVTIGCGAIVINALTGALTQVGIALTFGLIIMVMIAALGHLSGAHFNPAVTLAFALIRYFPRSEVPLYIGGQMVGAVLGGLDFALALRSRGQFGGHLSQR